MTIALDCDHDGVMLWCCDRDACVVALCAALLLLQDIRMSLYRNIVLSGGTTMYRGLPSRLDADIRSRYLKEVLKNDEARLKVRWHAHESTGTRAHHF